MAKNRAAVHLGRLAAKKNLKKGSVFFQELGRKNAIKRGWKLSIATQEAIKNGDIQLS